LRKASPKGNILVLFYVSYGLWKRFVGF